MTGWTKTRVALKSGTGFDRWTLDSGVRGDRVVIFGGTHGDETEGVIAANRIAGADLALAKGILEVVPIVHEAAFYADSRTSALDGADLARSFPGKPDGRPTEILADALHRQVLKDADLLIDLHTAGQSLDIPFIAGFIDDGRDKRGLSARAAEAFGADFIWRHSERPPGRTLSGLDAAIYTEYPAPGPTDLRCVESYVTGVSRVLAALGMIDGKTGPRPGKPSIKVVSGGNVDSDMQIAGAAGLFLHRVKYGEKVKQGQALGHIVDVRGKVLEEVRSPYDGWIVVLMRRPHVKPGDRLVAVAMADS